ncbi:MAG TPA: tetratricopeptide repeat protein [Candidatus Methylacidiphilales bacterium]|nr:tetratricopeptide repeat protein [Candidatus Methylacidiphilales bacterium]
METASTSGLDPKTWINLLTAHTAKGDVFSAKTLMAILEGVEKIEERTKSANPVFLPGFHTALFDRLVRSFNNPTLLKEVGLVYLGELGMPGIALKHFDLAHQFAPKDRDISELQKVATIAMARQATDQSAHSGIGEVTHPKPELGRLIRKTTRIDVVETRRHLDETAGELERKQQDLRKTVPEEKPKARTAPMIAVYDRHLKQAQRMIKQTDFAGAFSALAEAQQAGAMVEELLACYAQLGLSAFDHGRMDEALQAFLYTRDLVPGSVEGWFNCGLVYQKTGQISDALAAYLEASRLGPDNPKPWCNLSSIYFELGNYADAERAARQALSLKPDYARAWDNLAAALSAVNRLAEAAEACQEAIRFQPAFHAAWFKLGVINFQMDNLVAAEEAFTLTGDNPDFFSYVLYYLSMVDARRGETDLALQKLSQARAIDPTNELESSALKEIAAACTKAGRHVTAADFYKQIIAKRPDDFSAWLALGTSYHRAEQLDEARGAYRRVTELQPDNPIAWHNLGLLASEQEKHEESCECFQREVELCPDDAKAWYDLAVSLQSLNREEESLAAYERAESLIKSAARRSNDLSAALSIVRRINLGDRVLKTE